MHPALEGAQSHLNDIRLLDGQIAVIDEHPDRFRECSSVKPVHRLQHPNRLNEDDMSDPGAAGHERFGGLHLVCIVPSNKPQEDVGVSGVPGAASREPLGLLSTP